MGWWMSDGRGWVQDGELQQLAYSEKACLESIRGNQRNPGSLTSTEKPCLARTMAAHEPAGPAPTTTAFFPA